MGEVVHSRDQYYAELREFEFPDEICGIAADAMVDRQRHRKTVLSGKDRANALLGAVYTAYHAKEWICDIQIIAARLQASPRIKPELAEGIFVWSIKQYVHFYIKMLPRLDQHTIDTALKIAEEMDDSQELDSTVTASAASILEASNALQEGPYRYGEIAEILCKPKTATLSLVSKLLKMYERAPAS